MGTHSTCFRPFFGWDMMGQETKGSKDGKGKDSYYNWKDEKARFDERPVDPGPSQGQLQLRPDQCAVHRRSGQKGWLERKIQGLQRWQRKGAPEIEFPRNWDVLTV